MVNKALDVLDLLKNKYGLRVQLSMGQSERLIGPVHQIFLTVGRKEMKFHLGNEEFENLIVKLAWDEFRVDFTPADMADLKKQLKTITAESPTSAPRK